MTKTGSRSLEFHRKESGASRSSEDTWTLVYDGNTHELYVDHSWHHVFPSVDTGSERIELATFLKSQGRGAAKLEQIIARMFEKKCNA